MGLRSITNAAGLRMSTGFSGFSELFRESVPLKMYTAIITSVMLTQSLYLRAVNTVGCLASCFSTRKVLVNVCGKLRSASFFGTTHGFLLSSFSLSLHPFVFLLCLFLCLSIPPRTLLFYPPSRSVSASTPPPPYSCYLPFPLPLTLSVSLPSTPCVFCFPSPSYSLFISLSVSHSLNVSLVVLAFFAALSHDSMAFLSASRPISYENGDTSLCQLCVTVQN